MTPPPLTNLAAGPTGPASVLDFSFTVHDGGVPPLRVRRFELEEQVSGADRALVTVDVDEGLALSPPLGRSASLSWGRTGVAEAGRSFHGIVTAFTQAAGRASGRRSLYELQVEPAFCCLREGVTTRSFSDVTVLDLVRDVLSAELGHFGRHLTIRVPREREPDRGLIKRPLCVQYGESTFDFFRRILAEEGLAYFFDHAGSRETMVIADAISFDRPESPVPLGAPGPSALGAEYVRQVSRTHQQVPRQVALDPFDSLHPELDWSDRGRAIRPPLGDRDDAFGSGSISLPGASAVIGDDEQSDKRTLTDVAHRAEVIAGRCAVEAYQVTGEGNVMGFHAGQYVRLAPSLRFAPAAWLAQELLVESVRHEGRAPEATSSGQDGAGNAGAYENRFSARLGRLPFRPARLPKPIAVEDWGIVTTVADPIATDRFGRVHVRFLFDEDGTPSSAWIPLSQLWAGAGYGTQIIPRDGMLVRIEYQFGDPDRPVVADCFPTRRNALPSTSPSSRASRLVVKTRSLRDEWTNHHNEIALDDAADREELLIHAGWDFRRWVGQDERADVVNDESRVVGGSQSLEVGGAALLQVDVGLEEHVGGSRRVTVDGHEDFSVSKDDKDAGGVLRELIEGAQEVSARMSRSDTLDGLDTKRLKGGRSTTVLKADDAHHIQELRSLHVGALRAHQEKSSVSMKDGACLVDVERELEAQTDQARLSMAGNEPVRIVAKTLRLVCGSSTVSLEDGSLKVKSPTVLVRGASGSIELGPAGAAISGKDVVASAVMLNELKGPVVIIKDGSAAVAGAFSPVDVGAHQRQSVAWDKAKTETEQRSLSTVLWGRDGKAATKVPYRLRLPDGQVLTGRTDGSGAFTQAIPVGISSVELTFEPSDGEGEHVVTMHLPDSSASRDDRAALHLRNLGYLGPGIEMVDAVRLFQVDVELEPSGDLDAATIAALERVTGGPL
ncbi:MAG: type VI secretion system tip protein TssI/VgrG [Kofleriaceae bacterium]|nr:type VI secretion system tip protein TssI/VgrG [Kofleriaceae bacterium]